MRINYFNTFVIDNLTESFQKLLLISLFIFIYLNDIKKMLKNINACIV